MSKKLDTFEVQVDLSVWTSITIKADSFEDALERAKQLSVCDFIEVLGEHNDSSLELKGVYKQ